MTLRIPLTVDQPPPDLVTSQLPALRAYQLSLRAPDPPKGSFNVVAAQRGRQLFNGSAADLPAVVNHYNRVLSLGLSDAQKADLVEYLKSL